MALAEKLLAEEFNRPGLELFSIIPTCSG